MGSCGWEAATLSDTSPEKSQHDDGTDETNRPQILKTLTDHPGTLALYALLAALIISVVVRFPLPNEFWLALTGLLTGLGQQITGQTKDSND